MSSTSHASVPPDVVAYDPDTSHKRRPLGRLGDAAVFVLSIAASFALWEPISRSGAISQNDLPAMTTTVDELWTQMQTSHFWAAFGYTVRGWAIGLALATVLAVPLGIALGLSDFAAHAFESRSSSCARSHRPCSIPLLFLTLGTSLKSEVFLATFGAFWPLLVQTMYGVHDVDPVATDTAPIVRRRPSERLYRITLPSAVPYIATGMRIASTVALILAFTAELFMGTPGLGQELNLAQSYGLTTQVYALALATGVLGISTSAFSALERRVLSVASLPADRGGVSPRTRQQPQARRGDRRPGGDPRPLAALDDERGQSQFFPPPTSICGLPGAVALLPVRLDVVPSLMRILLGFGIAVVLGIGLGIPLGLSLWAAGWPCHTSSTGVRCRRRRCCRSRSSCCTRSGTCRT